MAKSQFSVNLHSTYLPKECKVIEIKNHKAIHQKKKIKKNEPQRRKRRKMERKRVRCPRD